MSRLKQILFGTRRRIVASVSVLVLLVASASAVAAFIIFSGLNTVNNNGTFTSQTQTSAAVEIALDPAQLENIDQNETRPISVYAKKLGNAASYTIAGTPTVDITSPVAGCASALSVTGLASLAGKVVSDPNSYVLLPGQNVQLVSTNAPGQCVGAAFTITFNGTTS